MVEELTGEGAATVAFGTEAPYFAALGMQTVVLGPGGIEQAHRPDEFCAVSEIDACTAFLRKVIAKAST